MSNFNPAYANIIVKVTAYAAPGSGTGTGTVTSVTSANGDISVANSTTTPVLTLNTGNLTETTSSVLSITNGTNSVIGSGVTIQVKQASATQSGYLSSTDWSTFNSKQSAITTGNITVGSNLSVSGGTGAVIGSGTSISLGANVVTSITNDTNITGSIASNGLTLGWTGTLAASRGGTGLDGSSALNGELLIGNGSGFSLATLTAGANITITNASGKITIAASASSGMTNPMTTLGDIIYEDSTPAPARLAGNTANTKKFLTQTGTGTASAAPSWGTIISSDLPTGDITESTSSVLTITGGSSSVIGSGTTIQVKQASSTQSGYLSSTDWSTFNGKQNAITQGNLTVGSNLSVSGGTNAVIGSGATISLGANVVTNITNDTNVTGSITSNVLTLGWTGTLSVTRGGTGSSTQNFVDLTTNQSSIAGNKTFTGILTAQQLVDTIQTVSLNGGTVTIDWSKGRWARCTLSANTTVAFSNPTDGSKYVLELIENATGGYSATLPTMNFGGQTYSQTTTASKRDFIDIKYSGTTYYAQAATSF